MKVPRTVWEKHNSRKPEDIQSYQEQKDTFVSLGFELMMEESGNKMLSEIWAHSLGWFIHVLTDKKSIIKIDLFGLEYNLFGKQEGARSSSSTAIIKKRKNMIFSVQLDLIWLKDISLIMSFRVKPGEQIDLDNFLKFIEDSHNISKMVPLKKINEEMFLEMFWSWLEMKKTIYEEFYFVNSNPHFNHTFINKNSDLLIANLFSRENTIEVSKGALVNQNFKHRGTCCFWYSVASFVGKSYKDKKCLKMQERRKIKEFVETIYSAEHISKWIPKIHEKTLGINNLKLLWLYLIGNTNDILNSGSQFSELCEMLSENSVQKLLKDTIFDKHCSDVYEDGVSLIFTTLLRCGHHKMNGEFAEAPLNIFLKLMGKSDIRQWCWVDEKMDFGGLLVEMIQSGCAIFNPRFIDVLEKLEKEKIWSIEQSIKIPPNYVRVHFMKIEMPEELRDFSNKTWKDLGEWLYLMGRENAEKYTELEKYRIELAPLFIYLTNKISKEILLDKVKRIEKKDSTVKQADNFRF